MLLIVLHDFLLSVNSTNFTVDAAELIAKDAVYLITVLRIHIFTTTNKLALKCHPDPVLLNYIASLPVS